MTAAPPTTMSAWKQEGWGERALLNCCSCPLSPVQIAFSKSPTGLCLYFIEPTGPCTTSNKWSWNKSQLYFTVLHSNIWQRKHRDTFGVNYLAVSYLWSPNIFTVVFFFRDTHSTNISVLILCSRQEWLPLGHVFFLKPVCIISFCLNVHHVWPSQHEQEFKARS